MAEVLFFLSLSVIFPFVIGLIRWRALLPSYGPFLLLLGLGLLAELATRYSVKTWIPVNNLYVLTESILIPAQFYAWGFMQSRKKLLILLTSAFILIWLSEHVIWGSIWRLHPYFRMFYSLGIVLLSINNINYMVVNEERNLLKHPVFIICSAFIIFFTYQLVYEGIYYIVAHLSATDTAKLTSAFSVINFFCNLLYGVAFLLVTSGKLKDWFRDKNVAIDG